MLVFDVTDVIDVNDVIGDHGGDFHSGGDFSWDHQWNHNWYHPVSHTEMPSISDMYDHHPDCDTAYDKDPIQNGVCNIAESNGFMDDTRECLIDEKAAGIDVIDRHLDCWGYALSDALESW